LFTKLLCNNESTEHINDNYTNGNKTLNSLTAKLTIMLDTYIHTIHKLSSQTFCIESENVQ